MCVAQKASTQYFPYVVRLRRKSQMQTNPKARHNNHLFFTKGQLKTIADIKTKKTKNGIR